MTMPKTITELWAWVAVESDGSEGILAKEMLIDGQHMFLPFVGADMARVESLRPHAEAMSGRFHKPIKLKHFVMTGESDG